MSSTTLGIKLDSSTRERLKAIAQRKERATHWVIKKAIEEYLTREEHAEAERTEDDARWQRYLSTGEAIPNDQVIAWLDELAAGQPASWRR